MTNPPPTQQPKGQRYIIRKNQQKRCCKSCGSGKVKIVGSAPRGIRSTGEKMEDFFCNDCETTWTE